MLKKLLFIILLISPLLMSSSNINPDKPKLYYFYDPLCGWCYGFSPIIDKIYAEYKNKINFEIIAGGLAIGNRAVSINEGYSYIKGALSTVTQSTGVSFGKAFVDLAEEGTYIYNSEPPCKAFTILKQQNPEKAFAFAAELHQAIFIDGKNLNDWEVLAEMLIHYNIEKDFFKEAFFDDSTKVKTYEAFAYSKQMGANGFPTAILIKNGKKIVLTRGYTDYANFKKALDSYLY